MTIAMPALLREASARQVVELTEWTKTAVGGLKLGDAHAVKVAAALRDRIDILETSVGLDIAATSWVGSIDVGPIRVNVRPKLPRTPLTQLFRYAYGLRDLALHDETQTPTAAGGIHDLLAAMLASEADSLLRQGLAKRPVQRLEKLESPRGRIALGEIARQGGVIEARLPCRHFDRRVDWHLNQILRAGLDKAATGCEDRDLRHRLHRLASAFPEASPQLRADRDSTARAQRELTRMTATYEPALALIRLLEDMQGVELDAPTGPVRIPGYLFDMNVFFQSLVSRFLHANLTGGRVEDEKVVRNIFSYVPDANPKRRAAPHVRPDYALFEGGSLRAFLDAKYRDVWDKGYPNQWLYQLAIYALASPSRVSIMLYASMADGATDEVIEMHSPAVGLSNESTVIVIRPVPLEKLAALIVPAERHRSLTERQQLATALASFPKTRSL